MARSASGRSALSHAKNGDLSSSMRTTRVTRSTSREPEPSTTASPNTRHAAILSRAVAPDKGKLPALPEEIADALSSRRPSDDDDAELRDDVSGVGRASVLSGISGLTALTSFSREEASNLDADVMVDVLPNLANAADVLANLLVHPDPAIRPIVWREIRTDGQRQNKLFRNRVEAMRVHKQCFGSTEYIQPDTVVRAMFDTASIENIPTDVWRPDDILRHVNLIEMLRQVVAVGEGPTSEEGHDVLRLLDSNFPRAIAETAFDRRAFLMSVQISAQLCIAHLASQAYEGQDPLTIIEIALFDPNDGKKFKYADALALHEASRSDERECLQEFDTTTQTIYAAFSDDSNLQESLKTLQDLYSWTDFLEKAVDFFQYRKERTDAQIAAAGGLDTMVKNLADAVEQCQNDRVAREMRQKLAQTTPKKKFGPNAIAALKAREKRNTNSPAIADDPLASLTSRPPVSDDNANGTLFLEGEEMADDGPAAVDERHTAQLQAQSSLQELSSLQASQQQADDGFSDQVSPDQRASSQRVSWVQDEPRATQRSIYNPPRSSVPGPYHVASSNKRTFDEIDDNEEEFDPTQDEGFQTDPRDNWASANAHRRHAAALARSSAADFPNSSRPSSGLLQSSHRSNVETSPRRNPGGAIPASMPPLDPDDGNEIPAATQFNRANALAKQVRLSYPSSRPPQARQPFTDEEVNAIIELIEEHGPHWSKIKGIDNNSPDGPRLARRDPEQIRQKARHMKMIYIKSGIELPTNFGDVALDKKAIDHLRACGIDYHQARIRG